MRSAGNFHPEWGYLAPAPSFMRTARIALVATAIGATAGAVVVVSLVVRPGANDENSSIAAHALVTAAPIVTAQPAVSAPPAGQTAALVQAPKPTLSAGAQAQTPTAIGKPETDNLASASKPAAFAAPPVMAAPNATALAEPTAVDVTPASPDSIIAPETSPTKRSDLRKRRPTTAEPTRHWQAEANARKRWRDNRGLGPLFRLFSFSDSPSDEN